MLPPTTTSPTHRVATINPPFKNDVIRKPNAPVGPRQLAPTEKATLGDRRAQIDRVREGARVQPRSGESVESVDSAESVELDPLSWIR